MKDGNDFLSTTKALLSTCSVSGMILDVLVIIE